MRSYTHSFLTQVDKNNYFMGKTADPIRLDGSSCPASTAKHVPSTSHSLASGSKEENSLGETTLDKATSLVPFWFVSNGIPNVHPHCRRCVAIRNPINQKCPSIKGQQIPITRRSVDRVGRRHTYNPANIGNRTVMQFEIKRPN